MAFVDQLVQDLATQGGVPEEVRGLLSDFVAQHRAELEALGEAGTRALFQTLLTPPASWDDAVGQMGQPELLALLQATGAQMDAATQAHAAASAAWRGLLAGLAQLAWKLAAQAVLAAL